MRYNNQLLDPINSTIGVKQGDSISPLLFNLGIDTIVDKLLKTLNINL